MESQRLGTQILLYHIIPLSGFTNKSNVSNMSKILSFYWEWWCKGKNKMQIKNKAQTRSIYFLILILSFWSLWYDFVQCSSAIHYCALYRYLLHLKQTLCHLCPPASFSSAAYTARSHLGHFDTSGALNGIVTTCKIKRNCISLLWKQKIRSCFCTKERQ